jgi:catechol 2,3-dioxygenase-like lactoylglutathione lyase family enzyme
MLTDGFNHVAVVTTDLDRFIAFYREVFDATLRADHVPGPEGAPPLRMAIVDVGPHSELNVFEMPENPEATRQTPMFGRGRLDHLAFQATSMDAFEAIRRRLVDRGAADEFVTDFGHVLSLFFRDPDGLECEVCVDNPDAVPGVQHPPGTPATRFVPS